MNHDFFPAGKKEKAEALQIQVADPKGMQITQESRRTKEGTPA